MNSILGKIAQKHIYNVSFDSIIYYDIVVINSYYSFDDNEIVTTKNSLLCGF